MSASTPDFAALVGSRICHDLVSPVGAIGNGIELMALEATEGSPELSLLSDSVGDATARLRFFRIAFGQPAPGQGVSCDEVRAILQALGRGGRVEYVLAAEGGISRDALRRVFLAVLCTESALPLGGTIRIAPDGDGWHIRGSADRIAPDKVPLDWLTGAPLEDVTPANVHVALLAQALAAEGRSAVIDAAPGATAVSIRI